MNETLMAMTDVTSLTGTTSMTEFHSNSSYSAANNTGSESHWPYESMEIFYQEQLPSIMALNRYFTIIWYVIGYPGNLLALAVWIQPRLRHSSGCYLAALAAADFLFLVLHLVLELQTSWDIRVLDRRGFCEAFPVVFYSTQYLSPLMVLAFTVERYISVCHPFRREKFCTTRRACIVIACLSCSVVALHVVQAYFWKFSGTVCDIRPEVAEYVWSIWSWTTELLVFLIVPLAILVLNIRVIVATQRITKNMERLLEGGRRRSVFTYKPSATTVTLLAVSFVHIATTLPVTVTYSLLFSFPYGDVTLSAAEIAEDPVWQRHLAYYGTKVVIEEVCMFHYAGNFLIYAATGVNFRNELRMLLRRWCPCVDSLLRRVCGPTGTGNDGGGDAMLELRTTATATPNGNGCERMRKTTAIERPELTPGGDELKPLNDVMQ